MARTGSSTYIATSGADDEAIGQGLGWLIAEASRAGNLGLVAVALKGVLLNLHWSKFAALFAGLHARGGFKVGPVMIGRFTPRPPRLEAFDGPILALYGGQRLLDAVDALDGPASVLYIPYIEGDHANWAATWGAVPLGTAPTPDVEPEEPTSGMTLLALRDLTGHVHNLINGILKPDDYAQAVRTLETLHHKGIRVSTEAIRQQLVRLGWYPRDARQVQELAEKIAAGRRPRGSKGRADDKLWAYWQSERK